MKKCKNCLTEKDVNDFHKKQSKCKECFKEFYRENKDHVWSSDDDKKLGEVQTLEDDFQMYFYYW